MDRTPKSYRMTSPVICWFKRDLRVSDHPALHLAAGMGPVLPLYIIEPKMWRQPDSAARHYAFIAECLEDLRDDLAQLGLTLVLRVGDAVEVLEALRLETGARTLVSHEETGNGWSFARDLAVAAWAAGQGVIWHEVPQCGVIRRLETRDHWQRQRDDFMRRPLLPPPFVRAAPACRSDPLPAPLRFRLDTPCPERQKGGRQRAEASLQSFLAIRGRNYRQAMSSPLEGAQACSRLSPHLAFGTLSVREAVKAGHARASRIGDRREGWAGSLASFQSRLAWRDHFMQKLEDEPRLESRCLHPAYEDLRPPVADDARLAAWSKGETGLPFVDACMRSLAQTGWLNFRMRSMLMAVASYHLWLDWRSTGPVLARLFTDYEPGIHWPQVQMQSGTTGMNTIRIYNPVKQGLDQDPRGIFTRRWLPELAQVPDDHLQTPWTWPGAGGLLDRAYPAPIVDVAASARAARERVWGLRKQNGFADEARRLVSRHASRKRPRRGIPQPDKQLSLDL